MRPVRDIAQRMKASLMRKGVSITEVDDLVQEAFVRLASYSQSSEVNEPEGFLMRTASNLVIDEHRRRKRAKIIDQPVEDLALVDNEPLPDAVWAGRKRLERLNAGFAALDPVTRRMLRAQRVEGSSVGEIARREGLSVSAVEKRLAKGMLFLVKWMDGW
ncbi:RNA polymerase sigma factor [Caulobacter soli]|uniref:RNA polymerase sigma factor n=1 Tax=Caulobacter soli TaxID=2708539 RepID=UPI0013E9AD34|nr:RNA polymerase sigma factor [Caulobacter soli]